MRYYADRSYVMGTFDIKIKDEEGNDRYVFSNQGKVGYNYALCDTSGKKYADIKQVISFRNKFRIQKRLKCLSSIRLRSILIRTASLRA